MTSVYKIDKEFYDQQEEEHLRVENIWVNVAG